MHTQKLERKKKKERFLNWISVTPLSRKLGLIEMDGCFRVSKGAKTKSKNIPSAPSALFSNLGVEASTGNLSTQETEEEESGVRGLM